MDTVQKYQKKLSGSTSSPKEVEVKLATPFDNGESGGEGFYLVKALNNEFGIGFAENRPFKRDSLDIRIYMQLKLNKEIETIKDQELKRLIKECRDRDEYPESVIVTHTNINSVQGDFSSVLCTFLFAEKYKINNAYAALFFGYDEAVNINTGKIIQNDADLTNAIEDLLSEQAEMIKSLGEKFKDNQKQETTNSSGS